MWSVERGQAIVQLLGLRLALRLRLARAPLDGLLQELGAEPRRGAQALSLAELGLAMDWAERVVEHVPGIGKSCLYRSLGRFGLLRSWGYRPAFVMGVASADPEQAHAWLELEGQPFRDESTRDFVVSFRFPPELSGGRC